MFTDKINDIEKFKNEYIQKYGGEYDIYLYDTYNMYMTRPPPSWFIEHEKKLQKTYKVTPEFFVTYDNYLKENFIDKGYIPGKITLL